MTVTGPQMFGTEVGCIPILSVISSVTKFIYYNDQESELKVASSRVASLQKTARRVEEVAQNAIPSMDGDIEMLKWYSLLQIIPLIGIYFVWAENRLLKQINNVVHGSLHSVNNNQVASSQIEEESENSPVMEHPKLSPELVAKDEWIGIDLNAFAEIFKGKEDINNFYNDVQGIFLDLEGKDLVEALNIARELDEGTSSQRLKRMKAALLAIKMLQESVVANVLTVSHEKGVRVMQGFYDTGTELSSICLLIEALYLFAKTGTRDAEIIREHGSLTYEANVPIKITTLFRNPWAVQRILDSMKEDNTLPQKEKEIVCKTFEEVINFLPDLV